MLSVEIEKNERITPQTEPYGYLHSEQFVGLPNPDLESLDAMFLEPDPKVATVESIRELGCPENLIPLIRSLNTPVRIQEYIDTHLIYNYSNTVRGFAEVVDTGTAHCFEGAMFANTLLWFHCWDPKLVLLQADNKYGEDHNIIVYRDKDHLGSIAMSVGDNLRGKPPIFNSLRDLVCLGYWSSYTSELEGKEGIHNLIGYTDPVDLVEELGTDWFFKKKGLFALEDAYNRYVSPEFGVQCTSVMTSERYPYPDEPLIIDATEGSSLR